MKSKLLFNFKFGRLNLGLLFFLFLSLNFISALSVDFPAESGIIYIYNDTLSNHNDLTGLQGGASGEYYHIEQSWFDELNSNLFDFITDTTWQYNQTTPFTNWLSTFAYNYNQTYTGGTYNATYDTWAYNQTYTGGTYNSTYDTWAYNQTYTGGTYNATYDTWAYNQTYTGGTYNETYNTWAYNQTTNVSGYVPYTNATSNVNLGTKTFSSGEITATGQGATIGNPTVVSSSINYGSGSIPNEGYYITLDVYAYKDVDSTRIYSSTPANFNFNDDGNYNTTYDISLNWTAVAGADGYKIVITEDTYNGILGDYYEEAIGGTSYVYPSSSVYEYPMIVTPTSLNHAFTSNGDADVNGVLTTTEQAQFDKGAVFGTGTDPFSDYANGYLFLKTNFETSDNAPLNIWGSSTRKVIVYLNRNDPISLGGWGYDMSSPSAAYEKNIFYSTGGNAALSFGTYDDTTYTETFRIDNSGNLKLKQSMDFRPSNNSVSAINFAQADGTDFARFDTISKLFKMIADNAKIIFGAGDDASIYYNATDMIINPKEVGTGKLYTLGSQTINGNITSHNQEPITTNTYSSGSSALRWLKGWFSGLDVQGTTNLNGNLNQTGGNATINNIYGGMNYHNYTGTTLPFGTASTYYSLYFTNGSNINGFKANNIGIGLNSSLTAQVSGMYQLIHFAVGSGQNNHEYHLVPFVNEVEIEDCEVMKKMSAGGDVNPMNGNCFVRLSVGNNVSLRIADYTGTGNGVYYGANLNLVRVGN